METHKEVGLIIVVSGTSKGLGHTQFTGGISASSGLVNVLLE